MSWFPKQSLFACCVLCLGWLAESTTDGETSPIAEIVQLLQQWRHQKDKAEPNNTRPFVTLTYAQSLDGKVAVRLPDGQPSSNLPLSGPESLVMTHALRSVHDGILVGGSSLLVDNPRLTNRLWGSRQPLPIVLDTNLRSVQELGSRRRAQNVLVCCSHDAAAATNKTLDGNLTLVPCNVRDDGWLDLGDVLHQLLWRGIRSVMVEGGARVLTSFVRHGLVDCVCVTIAPKLIGNERGVSSIQNIPSSSSTEPSIVDLTHNTQRFFVLGNDVVFCGPWPSLGLC